MNGREVGRENAPGEKDVPFPFDAGTIIRFESALASTPITLPKDHLVRGRNVLALHGLNSGVTSSDFTLIPIVRGDPPTDADEIVKRFAAFREAAKGEDAPRRLAYLDGRLLQRVGKHEEAVVKFDGMLSAEQARPVLRLTESLLAVGNPVAAESRLRGVLEAGIVEDPALCDEWLRVCLVELRRDPRAVLAEFPRVPAGDRGDEDRLENVKWLLGQLSTSGAVRINCGGGDHTARDGTLWGRDRFFSGGFRFFGDGESGATGPFTDDIVDTDDDPLYQTERWFPSVAPYRIPVPPGDYRVTLHFAEIVNTQKGSRFFDVRLEDTLVLLDYDPTMAGFATADRRSFPVEIRDGVLDLEFVHQLDYPKISAIEIVSEE